MRFVSFVVILLTLVSGCGRVGYDLLSRGDDIGGSAFGDDAGTDQGDHGKTDSGAASGDGDADGTPADDLDDAGTQMNTGGDGDADSGAPNPLLVACPAPASSNAALPLNRYEFARTDNLAEDSISLRNGSLTGATQAGGFAELSGSTGSYVQLPSGLLSTLGNATIMIWVRWDSGPQNQTILDFGQSDTNGLSLLASTPGQYMTLRFVTSNVALSVSATRSLTISTTHLITIELDASHSRLALYLDGDLQTENSGIPFALSDLRDDNMWLGRSNGSQASFKGGIEELRIYDTALGPCAIAAASAAGFASTSFARCADPESSCGFVSSPSGPFWTCDEELDFDTASQRCADAGMKLARVDSDGENQAIVAASSPRVVWIGLNDQKSEGSHAWCDGATASYQPWATGEPNDNGQGEDCASLTTTTGDWNDLRCSELHGFVCEP